MHRMLHTIVQEQVTQRTSILVSGRVPSGFFPELTSHSLFIAGLSGQLQDGGLREKPSDGWEIPERRLVTIAETNG